MRLCFPLFVALLAASGCVGDIGGLDGDDLTPDGPGSGGGGGGGGPQDSLDGKLSNNGLDLRSEAMDKIRSAPLGRYQGDQLVFAEEDFPGLLDVVTTDALGENPRRSGLHLLEYLVTCALDDDTELWIESEQVAFSGHLGLEPQWATETCDESCQRWLTACVLAHTNPSENPVMFSPRASHPALGHWTEEHVRDFPYQEAGYYGNLFMPAAQRMLFACAGSGSLAEFEDSDLLDLGPVEDSFDGRVCASGIACDFELAGLCKGSAAVFPEYDFTACEELVGQDGYFRGCGDAFADVPVLDYEEVITVYLTDAL